MNKGTCGWSEEEIVDLAFGKLDSPKAERLKQHLYECRACESLFEQWQNTLAMDRMLPDVQLKQQILKRIRYSPLVFVRLLKQRITTRIASLALTACAAVAILFAIPLQTHVSGSPLPVNRDTLISTTLLSDPKTVQYPVATDPSRLVSGYLLINRQSNEVLLCLQGLPIQIDKDYQTWLITANTRSNGGLLKPDHGKAVIYLHRSDIGNLQNMAISIEPKGGSAAPSGPDLIFVRLQDGP